MRNFLEWLRDKIIKLMVVVMALWLFALHMAENHKERMEQEAQQQVQQSGTQSRLSD